MDEFEKFLREFSNPADGFILAMTGIFDEELDDDEIIHNLKEYTKAYKKIVGEQFR